MVSASPRLAALQERIGIRFRDQALLLTALTHPSYANEHPEEESGTNERLEFLGDAVLGLVVAEALYEQFPDQEEGRLTEWRAQLVMGPTLARVAETLDLGAALRLGRGEEATGGRLRERNLERVYEALVGALMLDRGLQVARDFVQRTLQEEFDGLDGDQALVNPKGALQQLTQGERRAAGVPDRGRARPRALARVQRRGAHRRPGGGPRPRRQQATGGEVGGARGAGDAAPRRRRPLPRR